MDHQFNQSSSSTSLVPDERDDSGYYDDSMPLDLSMSGMDSEPASASSPTNCNDHHSSRQSTPMDCSATDAHYVNAIDLRTTTSRPIYQSPCSTPPIQPNLELVKIDGRFPCQYCSSIYSAGTALRQHERQMHAEKLSTYLYSCQVCQQRFASEHGLKTHIGKAKTCRSLQQQHQLLSNNQGVATATMQADLMSPLSSSFICDNNANNNNNNNNCMQDDQEHVAAVVVNEPQFCCRFCPNKFMQPDYLKKHERRVHPNSLKDITERGVVCSVCHSKFSSTRSLNGHLRMSTICQAAFRQRLLDPPATDHSSPNSKGPYLVACKFCPSTFSAVGTLRKHERNFHMDKLAPSMSLICQACRKPFVSQNALTCHLRISLKCCAQNSPISSNKIGLSS